MVVPVKGNENIGNCDRIGKCYFKKTWRLIVTEAPVQMPLLFIGQCVPKANELPYGSLHI